MRLCLSVFYKKMMSVLAKLFRVNSSKCYDEADNKERDKTFDFFLRESTCSSQFPISPASPHNTVTTTTGLNKEKNRLLTFTGWSLSTTDKRLLAQIGFYYIGPTDLVKCHFCDVEIGMWQPEDNPVDERLRWSPDCPLLHGRKTVNEPDNVESLNRILPAISNATCDIRSSQSLQSQSYAEISVNYPNPSNIRDLSPLPRSDSSQEVDVTPPLKAIRPCLHKHPEFAVESHRLVSFEDWPKTMKQKPKELAEAGFYYTGRGDRVSCFSCGGGLKDWEEMDIPWEQHTIYYSKCEYLKLMKGQKFINKILTQKSSNPSSYMEVLNTDTVAGSGKNMKMLEVEMQKCASCLLDVEAQKPAADTDSKMCKICYECEYNTVFFPCGHIITCAKCASNVTKCPYCLQPFAEVMRVYFS